MRSDGTARCNPIGAPRHQLRGCCQRKWSPASGDHGHSSEGAVIPASLPRRTLYRSSRVFRTAEQGRRRQSSLLSPACAAGRMSLLFQYRRMEPAWHGWTIAIVPCRKALAAELVQCPFPMRTAASASCADRERLLPALSIRNECHGGGSLIHGDMTKAARCLSPVASQIDVIGPCPAMSKMCLGHLQNQPAQWRQGQPLWHLMAKRAHTDRNRPLIARVSALSRNHQQQPTLPTLPLHHEADKRAMRL